MQIQTASGPGSAELDEPAGQPVFLVALTHGAGGGVQGADLVFESAEASRGQPCGKGQLFGRGLEVLADSSMISTSCCSTK